MDRFRLKNDAKTDIRGRVWLALQPLLMIFIIDYSIGIFSSLASRADKAGNYDLYVALTVIYSILSFVFAVLYFSLYVGTCKYFIYFMEGKYLPWTIIFDGMKNSKRFWQQFLCYVVTGILTILGIICLIVPGVLLAIRYSMIGFVFADNPFMKWKDAAKRSAALMEGHYGEYLFLILSFFWWWCLAVITFGIALIYVAPYMQCTMARYYKSLKYLKDGKLFTNNSFTGGNGNPFAGGFGGDSPFEGDGADDVKYPFDIN